MTAWYTASCVQLTITLEEILIAFACYANGIYIKKPWKQLTNSSFPCRLVPVRMESESDSIAEKGAQSGMTISP